MGAFPTTRWSLILAGRNSAPESRAALQHLCVAYRAPVLAYVRRRHPETDAEDLTQAFFTALIERHIERIADPARGRFRNLLLASLQHYLANEREQRQALRRGGGRAHEPIEAADLDGGATSTDDPEQAFQRSWALTVLARAMQRLRLEAQAAGKGELFEALREGLMEGPEASDYAAIGERLGLRRNTVAVSMHRLRQRLRACVRTELADTVADDSDVDAELDALRLVLGGSLRAAPAAPPPSSPSPP